MGEIKETIELKDTDSRYDLDKVHNLLYKIPEHQSVLKTEECSHVSITAVTNGRSQEGHYFKLVSEGNGIQRLTWNMIPRRYENQSVISFYSTLKN